MKKEWKYRTIGDLCDKMNGLWKGKTGPFVNVGVIRNANFTKSFTLSFDNIEYLDVEAKQYKTRKLQKGDLIVEKSGGSEKQPVGRTVLFDREEGEYSFSNFTSVLRIKDRSVITPEFLYKYILFVYLHGDTRKMQKATTGIHNIEFDKFLSIPVPKLPLSEQQSIVDYLDSAFAKIDAMKANVEKALNEAKALFQAFLKEMLEPKEGWNTKALKEICKVINGRAYSKEEMLKHGKYRLLRVGNFFTNDNWYYSDLELEEDKYCNNGDLLYAWSASFGPRIWDGEKVIYHYHIWKMVCSDEIDKYFLCYWLDSDELKKQTMNNLHGATMAHVTKGIIEAAFVGFPPLSEQQSIVATLDSLKSKVDRQQENFNKISQECDALKQAILRQVFD